MELTKEFFDKVAAQLQSQEQVEGAKNLYALLGGASGAGGGAMLGRYLGGEGAEALGLDEDVARLLGAGVGALGGGALGALSGHQLGRMLHTAPTAVQQEAADIGLYPGNVDQYAGYDDSNPMYYW